ncbi:hypothetical protein EYF80_028563 [Liparis tanakae]|uniref:Uncharacterized protein n=1 Tax=Liparis tanakae TaxID=230148 RepID=A0A4Z2H5M5_9TELE|nr:hypothetical protein EYF80_028563 [Liparis tanakae]
MESPEQRTPLLLNPLCLQGNTGTVLDLNLMCELQPQLQGLGGSRASLHVLLRLLQRPADLKGGSSRRYLQQLLLCVSEAAELADGALPQLVQAFELPLGKVNPWRSPVPCAATKSTAGKTRSKNGDRGSISDGGEHCRPESRNDSKQREKEHARCSPMKGVRLRVRPLTGPRASLAHKSAARGLPLGHSRARTHQSADSTDMVDAPDEMPESLPLYTPPPNEDDGEDEDAGDEEEALRVRRMAPVALQWGRGPGSGV